jgi:hypothetical protein
VAAKVTINTNVFIVSASLAYTHTRCASIFVCSAPALLLGVCAQRAGRLVAGGTPKICLRFGRRGQRSKPRTGLCDSIEDVEQVPGAARKPVEPSNEQHITCTERREKSCRSDAHNNITAGERLIVPEG